MEKEVTISEVWLGISGTFFPLKIEEDPLDEIWHDSQKREGFPVMFMCAQLIAIE